MSPIPILISAGEASGDMYAARLARALHERADVSLFGMGGPRMREAGVDVVAEYSAVVGFSEVVRHLPELRRAMRRRGIQNVYFVCPQFWAWRPWRARVVHRRFALGLCIFSFEEKFYRDAGVP